jgi:hypothetical protein
MFSLSPPLSGTKARHPSQAQLDPGTAPPFKYRGLFYCSHFEKSLEYAVQRIFGGLGKNTHVPGVSENHLQLQLL